MKPESPEVIRAHTEAVLAKLHLLDGLMEAGSPMPERARRNLELCADYIERIQSREEIRNDRAA